MGGAEPAELLTPTEMAAADAAAMAAGVAGAVLMENAGRAVARAARRRFAPARTLVLCGPGNNGGDGYVAARLLEAWGWPVAVAALAPPRPGSDAAAAAARWRGPMVRFAPAEAARAALVVDAVFGAGLSGPVEGVVAQTLAAARRLVAIDVPSGVDGATGAVRGFAPRAALTVTFFRRKPGHLLLPGRDLCGRLECHDIGIPAAVLGAIRPATLANGPGLWSLPPLPVDAHKYSRGHVSVLAGEMAGAARLAAAAARRAGAGMVTLVPFGPPPALVEPGLIIAREALADLVRDPRRKVWVAGPGLGREAARAALPALLVGGKTVVADADALTAHEGELDALVGVAVATPHAGEFARLFGLPGTDRLAAARAAARRLETVMVLKGPDTVIASADGRAAINQGAPADLATAGAGDVLAGVIAALLARGMAPFEAACAGVWLHGRAAAGAGAGLIAEDLPPLLARAAAGPAP